MIKNTASLNIRHNNTQNSSTQNTSYKKSPYNYVWAFLGYYPIISSGGIYVW